MGTIGHKGWMLRSVDSFDEIILLPGVGEGFCQER